MNDQQRLINAVYEFFLFELSRREDELHHARVSSRGVTYPQDLFAIVSAWVKLEYLKSWYREFISYLEYFI